MLLILGVMLLILKLAGAVTWAWWIILIPFYPAIAVSIAAVITIICGVSVGIIAAVYDAVTGKGPK